jgi:4-amino-4-deoxy-L-arabinose transferase-like glycosyltransferase
MSSFFSKLLIFIKKRKFAIALIIALPILLFPLFYRLGAHPIYQWDESRQAYNMTEMLETGNPLVTYFEGKPDHYNTKPPLLIWFQAFFMLLTDNPELSLRLPSALAGLGIVFAIIWLFKIYLNKPFWGILGGIFLVGTSGFIELHATRTGDYDAFVTFWIVLMTIQYFLFLEKKDNTCLYRFFLFFGLAIATKASVPLMVIPILFLWTLFTKNLRYVLTSKAFYKGIAIPIGFILLFYGVREIIDPGYLKSAWYNDFGGRFGGAIDGHTEPFDFYIKNLYLERAKYFFVLLPLCFLILFSKNEKIRKVVLYSLLFVFVFLLTISIASTKIFWYDLPLIPFIVIAFSTSLATILSQLHSKIQIFVLPIIIASTVYLLYLPNAKKIIESPNFPWEGPEHYQASQLIREAVNGKQSLENIVLLRDEPHPSYMDYYVKRLHKKQGYFVNTKRRLSEVRKNQKFIYYQPQIYDDSLAHYKAKKVKDMNKENGIFVIPF